MTNKFNSKGSAVLVSLLAVSFTAVLFAGWNLGITDGRGENPIGGIERYGYEGFSVKPKKGKSWWKEEKKKDARKKRRVIKSDQDLGRKNKGLKDPDEVVWPYGREFSYSMVIRGFFAEDMPSDAGFILSSKYKADADGGKLKDVWSMEESYFSMAFIAEITFDEHKLVQDLSLRMQGSERDPGYGSENFNMSIDFSNKGDTVYTTFKFPPDMFVEASPRPMEFECPLDGFFYLAGADTPGSTAMLLSALDLDNGPASVWVFCPSLMTLLGEDAEEVRNPTDFLVYIDITELPDCSAETNDWWKRTRGMYDDWRPASDIRTFVFEGPTEMFFPYYNDDWDLGEKEEISDILQDEGPFMVAYIDDEGRVVRIEQPGGFFTSFSELEEIDSGTGWWSKAQESDKAGSSSVS